MDRNQRQKFHAKIAKAVERGQSRVAVAAKYNVSLQTVYNVMAKVKK